MANSNPNVGFLRGTQDKVNTVLANQAANNFNNNVVEGAFYITSDTNRMYIGKKDSSNNTILASLNAGIVVVESYSDLPSQAEQGVFYYIKGKEGDTIANVLCIRSGENWIQVNSINNVQKLTTDTESVEGGAKVETVIEDKIGSIKDSYTVKGKNGIGVSSTANKDGLEIAAEQIKVVASATSTSTASVSLNDSNLVNGDNKAFNIALASGDAGNVAVNGNTITLTTQDTKVTNVSTAVADVTGGGVQITTDLTDTGNNDITASSFTVKGENLTVEADGTTGLKITAEQVKVGTDYNSTSKTATVSLTSDLVDSSENNFKLVAGDKVAFSRDASTGAITISSTASDTNTTNEDLIHELSTANGVVTVKTSVQDSANNFVDDSFTVTGSTGISVSSSDKAITIAADDITITTSKDSGKGTATATFASGLMSGDEQNLVFKNGNANVTIDRADDGAITIAAEDTTNETLTFGKSTDDEGKTVNGFDVVLKDSRGQSITGKFNPVIAYGHTGTGDNVRTTATANFSDNTASLDIYTASEVDAIIEEEFRTFNAMEYQGVITALPADTSKIKNGYTYLVGDDGLTIGTYNVSPGSLVIAKGTEGADGYIDGNITWDYITANLTDTLYELVAKTGGFDLKDNHNQTVGSFVVAGGDGIVVNTNGTASGNAQKLTIEHDTYATTKSATTNDDMGAVGSYTFDAIDSLTIVNGHITGYTVTSHKVVDSVATVSKNEFTIAAVEGAEQKSVSVKNEVVLAYDDGSSSAKDDSFTLTSANNNLTVSTAGNGSKEISLNLVWGTF